MSASYFSFQDAVTSTNTSCLQFAANSLFFNWMPILPPVEPQPDAQPEPDELVVPTNDEMVLQNNEVNQAADNGTSGTIVLFLRSFYNH